MHTKVDYGSILPLSVTHRDKTHEGVSRVFREIFGVLAGCSLKVPECLNKIFDYRGCTTRHDFLGGVGENMSFLS